ncbi:MAG: GlsB/YeaQ/YmgE family stress response membrane protein [Burkholderiales bacterium]
MDILLMILFGLIVGVVAKMLMPGRDPGGIVITIVLGVLGSLLGGFLFNAVGIGDGVRYAGFIGSLIGALLLLFAYRLFTRRSGRTHA